MVWRIALEIQLGVATLVSVPLGFFIMAVTPGRNDTKLKDLFRFCAASVLVIMILGTIFGAADIVIALIPLSFKVAKHVLVMYGPELTQIAICLLIVAVGSGAYWLKCRDQLIYGLVEVIFGGAAAFVTARFAMISAGQIPGAIATLIGSAYVVSRGIGNYVDGAARFDKELRGNFVTGLIAKVNYTVWRFRERYRRVPPSYSDLDPEQEIYGRMV